MCIVCRVPNARRSTRRVDRPPRSRRAAMAGRARKARETGGTWRLANQGRPFASPQFWTKLEGGAPAATLWPTVRHGGPAAATSPPPQLPPPPPTPHPTTGNRDTQPTAASGVAPLRHGGPPTPTTPPWPPVGAPCPSQREGGLPHATGSRLPAWSAVRGSPVTDRGPRRRGGDGHTPPPPQRVRAVVAGNHGLVGESTPTRAADPSDGRQAQHKEKRCPPSRA